MSLLYFINLKNNNLIHFFIINDNFINLLFKGFYYFGIIYRKFLFTLK